MFDYSLLHELYETQKQLPERNFAKGHSFDEWLGHRHQRPTETVISGAALNQLKQDLKLAGCVGIGTTVTVDAEALSALIASQAGRCEQ